MRFTLPQIVRTLIIIISLGLCLSSVRTIYELWQRTDIVSVREQELYEIKKQTKALEEKLMDTKSEAYVEREARNKLGMVREGETIVILPQTDGPTNSNEIEPRQNWKKWWNLFF